NELAPESDVPPAPPPLPTDCSTTPCEPSPSVCTMVAPLDAKLTAPPWLASQPTPPAALPTLIVPLSRAEPVASRPPPPPTDCARMPYAVPPWVVMEEPPRSLTSTCPPSPPAPPLPPMDSVPGKSEVSESLTDTPPSPPPPPMDCATTPSAHSPLAMIVPSLL